MKNGSSTCAYRIGIAKQRVGAVKAASECIKDDISDIAKVKSRRR